MSVEQHLRKALRDQTETVAGWPDPVSRVERGVGARRRRRLTVTLAAAVTAVVAVAAAGLVRARPFEPPPPVLDATGPEVPAPSIQYRSARPDRLPCSVEKVTEVEWIVKAAPWGLATGFGIRPFSEPRCTLSGRPTLYGVDTVTGERVPVPFVQAPPGETTVQVRQFPATIDPGEVARFAVRGGQCPAGQQPRSYRDLSLRVGEHEMKMPSFRTLTDVCGAHVSDWFVEPPMAYAPLHANIEAPTTLRRGETFSYTLRLVNGYRRELVWQGCPVYLLGLGDQGRTWRRLDCARNAIGPNSIVRLKLTGQIPADAATGPARLTWIGVLPNGEAVIADMDQGGLHVTITE